METAQNTPLSLREPVTTAPFSFLDRSLNVLFIDDQEIMRDVLAETIAPLRLYSVASASTAREASALLGSGVRFHVCVMDLGICDIDNDEFALLKKFGSNHSFIVLTSSQFPSKGFDCYRLGAHAVIEKATAFDDLTLVHTLNKQALLNIINPRHREGSEDTTTISTDVLFGTSPETVTEWARELGISDRQLRKLWKNDLGYSAKHSLFVYHLYSQAFQFREYMLDHPDTAPESVPGFDPAIHRKLEQYFHLHMSTIVSLIS